MEQTLRFSHLSPARQALVRYCQAVNFGDIRDVRVRDADPIFEPAPVVVIDAKLYKVEEARKELELSDFDLRDEVRRLLDRLDEIKNGMIERIEVRAGIPRRMVFTCRST